jgi:hypothetical protein
MVDRARLEEVGRVWVCAWSFVAININRHVRRLLVMDAGRCMRRVRIAGQADEGSRVIRGRGGTCGGCWASAGGAVVVVRLYGSWLAF